MACGVISTVTATAILTNTKSVTLTARSQGGTTGITNFCTGSNFELLVNSINPAYAQPNSYVWAGPNGYSSTVAVPLISNVTASNAGVYTLTVNFGNPCGGTVTATINITIGSFLPSLFARRIGQTSNAFTFCSGTDIELYNTITPSGGTISSYSWTGPNGFSSTALSPQIANMQAANTGTYRLTVTVSGGACAGTYTTTNTITVGSTTQLISNSQPTVQCPGGTITLTALLSGQNYGSGTTYSWTGPNGFTSASQNNTLTNLQPINAGTYTITSNFPSSSGCAASGTATSTIKLAIGNTSANVLPNQNQTVAANTNFPLSLEILGGTLPITINLSNGGFFVINSNSVNGSLGNVTTFNTSVPSSQTITISSATSACPVGINTGSAVISVVSTVISIVTGNWENASTWNVARVPVATDNVILGQNHIVTITTNAAAAKKLEYRTGSRLNFGNTVAKLNLGF